MQPHRMSGHAVHVDVSLLESVAKDGKGIAHKIPDPELVQWALLIGRPHGLCAQQQAGLCCPAPQLALWWVEVCLCLPAQMR